MRPASLSDLLSKIHRYYAGHAFALCFVLANEQVCLAVMVQYILFAAAAAAAAYRICILITIASALSLISGC